jgi:hypothetical protein
LFVNRPTSILVSSEELGSDDPWVVVDSLSDFAKRLGEFGFASEDLPDELLWNSQVTNALVQINRNGPSLYFYNVLAAHDGTERWHRIVNATKQGLRALGDIPQTAAFEHLLSLYEEHRAVIVQGRRDDRPFVLPNDFDLLCQFMPSSEAEDEFMERRAAWVRSLDKLRAVPRDDYEQEIAKYAGPAC